MPTSPLPLLPIPDLQDTVARFEAAARPLFSANEFEICMEKLNNFAANEGPILQQRLRDRADTKENWLEEWWDEYAYFLNRASVCFNVNYFFGFRDPPQPIAQTHLAAVLIESALRFRHNLESGLLEPDNIRGKPMCMHQYQYMFATCRHPGETKDWTEIYSSGESSHVAIAHKGRFFALRLPPINHADDTSSSKQETIVHIERCLQAIVDNTSQQERTRSIGVLTAALRDDWYAARECLVQVSSQNADSLRVLESAAFLVSLESTSPSTHQEFSHACHCGDGTNRYFDKNFQILVFANGRYGFNGEHSYTDATTDMRLCGAVVKDVEQDCSLPPQQFIIADEDKYRSEEITFDYSSELLDHIRKAATYFDSTVACHELSTLVFDHFGKEQIKQMKVSPDAFVQMAMQLAYYRKFRHVPPTYESASTKAFSRGRTETSRSVSQSSAEWCKAMVDRPGATSMHQKAELLKLAITHQSQFTALCAKGSGIDRHLLGLEYALLPGEEKPAVFSDPVFVGSRHWKLSTSQISDPILAAYGWGEVVDDGFGVAYRIENDSLSFNVVSYKGLGSSKLCQYLSDALMDMRFLLTNAHKLPHEIKAEVDAVANVLSSIKLLSSSSSSSPRRSRPSSPLSTSTNSNDSGSSFRSVPNVCAENEAESQPMVGELEQLPSNDIIRAIETRLSRFVKESFQWALPSTS